MKRITFHFLFLAGFAGPAMAGLAESAATNAASAPAGAETALVQKTDAAPAVSNAAPGTLEPSMAQKAETVATASNTPPAAAAPAPVPPADAVAVISNSAPTVSNAPPAHQPAPVALSSNAPPATPMVRPAAPAASNTVAAKLPPGVVATNTPPLNPEYEVKIEFAREQRRQKDLPGAALTLKSILTNNAPSEMQRVALLELALVTQDGNDLIKAQQILGQYLHLYPEDPTIPDILLKQGLLYRQMGVNTMAVSKFYAVMSSALKLKLENIDYYRKLVVQAQTEIADTYFLEAKYADAADFFGRIIKAGDAEGNREQLECKLIRSLSYLTNYVETIGKAQSFLDRFPKTSDVPEIRFLLASALKSVGRNQDSMKQVLLLLQSQQANVRRDPETWIYWQRRAGNEIANLLYKEGDYLDALQIYLSLAELDKSPAWQIPVWYQIGMVYEQLQQWQKAGDMYAGIIDRQKEFDDSNRTPMLDSLVDMAKWRSDYIAWAQKARAGNLALEPVRETNAAAANLH